MKTDVALRTTQQVLDEILAGTGRTCAAAAKQFPAHRGDRNGLDPSTVWRWIAKGVNLSDGRRIKLEAARVGGRVLTSEPAVRRFVEAQAALSVAEPEQTHRTPSQRQRAADLASQQLEKMGV